MKIILNNEEETNNVENQNMNNQPQPNLYNDVHTLIYLLDKNLKEQKSIRAGITTIEFLLLILVLTIAVPKILEIMGLGYLITELF